MTPTRKIADDGRRRAATPILQRGMSAAEMRAAWTAAFGAWGFEGSIEKADAYWQQQPAAADPEPLTLAWHRARIVQKIADVRAIVALRKSPDPLPHGLLEYWIVQAMDLGQLTEAAAWRFNLPDDARLGMRVREQWRALRKAAAVARRRAKAGRDADLMADVQARRRDHPTDSRAKEARALLAQHERRDHVNADRTRAAEALRKRIARLGPK